MFRPPVEDLLFSLRHVAGYQRVAASHPDADLDTVAAVLEAAGSFCAEVIAPLNRKGDLIGAQFKDGEVRAVPGFAEAFREFSQGGWNGVSADPEHGGMGLPRTVQTAIYEMVQSANLSFALCPMLTQSALEALAAHGTERQKQIFLTRLVSGEWTGTMNLTEPQAGSDLAAITTRAEPDGEGAYRLFGQKIFITWGEHDIAPNIVHLVLARLPDAPPGVKGISLFLAPKMLVDDEGAILEGNELRCGGIEHKLGIHGSPTCVMLYEGAKAEMIGEPGQGLPMMFTMMNAARLLVGVQGVALAERAYQHALSFAKERRQGRSPITGEAGAPIFDHPDIRRTLMLMKAKVEAARAICLSTAVAADLGEAEREELLTPYAKAWSTDVAVEVASAGVQVHGGMGFVEETGAAQHLRDARILPIYEGTNGIQALDLVGRKLRLANGQAMASLIADIRETAHAAGDERLLDGAAAMELCAAHLAQASPADAAAGASAFLSLSGDVVGGWMLAKAALADPGGPRAALSSFYGEQVLSTVPGRIASVTRGLAELEGFAG